MKNLLGKQRGYDKLITLSWVAMEYFGSLHGWGIFALTLGER